MEDIHKVMKRLREERKWSQGEVAQRLGIDQPTYSLLERGGRRITAEMVFSLSKVFRVSVLKFFGEEGSKNDQIVEFVEYLSAMLEDSEFDELAELFRQFASPEDAVRLLKLWQQSPEKYRESAAILLSQAEE